MKVDQLEEREHVGRLVGLLGVEEHLAGPDVHGGEQIGGAVPLVVMGHGRPRPCFIGREGWVRSRAWTWVFSSKLKTTARSGGFR